MKWPITLTVFALGAHTRKPTPSDDTIAPMPADGLGESVSLGEGDADSALGEAAVGDITALGDVLVAVGGTVAQALSNRATPRALSAREVMAMRQR